jgi:O-antigen/teichoic acid export membrane protein
MRLRHAVLRSVIQQNATMILSFGTGIIIARLLTPAEFGAYSIAIAVLFIAMALKDFGIGSYVISAPMHDEAVLRSGFGLSLALTLLITAALITASFPLARFYGDETLGHILRVAAFGPLALSLVFPATILLTRTMRFDALLVIGLCGAAIQSLVSITLALQGYGATALGWGNLAGAVATALTTLAYRPDILAMSPRYTGWLQFLRFSGWMSATLAVSSTATSTPQLLLGRVAELGTAALFARAHTLASLVLNGFFFAVTRPMLPGLAETERRDGNIAPLYLRIVEVVTGLAWPAYAALAFWATPLVTMLYGPNWSAAGAMIPPIALGHALLLSVAPHHDVLIVKRRPGLLFISELTIFAVSLAALLAGLMMAKAETAVWSISFGGAFFALWYFFALRGPVGFRTAELAAVWRRSLTLTLAALPGILIPRELHAAGMLGFPAAFALSAVTAGCLWLLAVRACRHELLGHINPVLEQVLARARKRRRTTHTQASHGVRL